MIFMAKNYRMFEYSLDTKCFNSDNVMMTKIMILTGHLETDILCIYEQDITIHRNIRHKSIKKSPQAAMVRLKLSVVRSSLSRDLLLSAEENQSSVLVGVSDMACRS